MARRVVMIKSPDPKIFEEAIFIVREETGKRPGVTCEQLLKEAMDVAENYVRSQQCQKRPRPPLPWYLYTVLGGSIVGIAWTLTSILL